MNSISALPASALSSHAVWGHNAHLVVTVHAQIYSQCGSAPADTQRRNRGPGTLTGHIDGGLGKRQS